MYRRNDNFGKTPLLFKIVPVFIGIVFLMVIAYFIGLGYLAVKAVNSIDGETPKAIGKVVGEFLQGIEEGKDGK